MHNHITADATVSADGVRQRTGEALVTADASVVAVGQRLTNAFIFAMNREMKPSTLEEIFKIVNSSEGKRNEFLEEIEIPIEIFELVFREKLLSESLANTIISKLKSDREKKSNQRDLILESNDLESIKNFLGISL